MFHDGEPEFIVREFQENLGITLERIDAQAEFLEAFRGVTDEKKKAQIASERMIQVLARQINDDPDVRTVVLGTNFNDTLFGQSPIPALQKATESRQPLFLQPLQNLFKDEIRRLAQALSLPGLLCLRQPFPTSGLASRIFGEVTPERLQVLRRRTPAWKRKLRKAVLSASSGSIIPCSAKARTCPGTTPSFCGPCRRGAARLPVPGCPLTCWNGFPSACCGSCPAFPEWFTT